ncbi:MAG: hypothetical protein FWC47_06935 [Oscillospiraceae bacterium]|nr:hypothetical protein [Oscillospiraceae bacterium]
MKTEKFIDLLNADECIVINSISKDILPSEFTRNRLLEHIQFIINMSTDKLVLDLADGLKEKVLEITDDEWNDIKKKIPFSTPYGEDCDRVPEPDDYV